MIASYIVFQKKAKKLSRSRIFHMEELLFSFLQFLLEHESCSKHWLVLCLTLFIEKIHLLLLKPNSLIWAYPVWHTTTNHVRIDCEQKRVYYACGIELHPSPGVLEFKSQRGNFSGPFLILFDFLGGKPLESMSEPVFHFLVVGFHLGNTTLNCISTI